MAASLFYLSRNPVCQANARLEVRSAFSQADQIIHGPVLEQCTYLRACLDEAIRMSPPAPGLFFRRCTQDCVIDSVSIPAGTGIAVGVHALHHNPEYFPEPFKYKPERFLEKGAREAFVPFLRGYRSCPAQRMAYPMMLVPLARILWTYDFQPHSDLGCGPISELDCDSPYGRNVLQLEDHFTSSIRGPSLVFRKL